MSLSRSKSSGKAFCEYSFSCVLFDSCERERTELRRLQSVINIINQTVGDAISDMLLVELVLCSKGWSAEDWNAAYTDLPNRQLKVKVGINFTWYYDSFCKWRMYALYCKILNIKSIQYSFLMGG